MYDIRMRTAILMLLIDWSAVPVQHPARNVHAPHVPCIQWGTNLDDERCNGAVQLDAYGTLTVYVGATLPKELIEAPDGRDVTIRKVNIVR